MFENDESKVYDAAMILRLHEIMECNLFTMPHILTAVELNRCGSYCVIGISSDTEECYFDIYFPRCCATFEINPKQPSRERINSSPL